MFKKYYDELSSHVTKETFKINRYFDCKESYLSDIL